MRIRVTIYHICFFLAPSSIVSSSTCIFIIYARVKSAAMSELMSSPQFPSSYAVRRRESMVDVIYDVTMMNYDCDCSTKVAGHSDWYTYRYLPMYRNSCHSSKLSLCALHWSSGNTGPLLYSSVPCENAFFVAMGNTCSSKRRDKDNASLPSEEWVLLYGKKNTCAAHRTDKSRIPIIITILPIVISLPICTRVPTCAHRMRQI